MTPAEQAFLERARVGSLATVDGNGRPHAVPICFAILEPASRADPTDANGPQRGDTDDEPSVRLVSAIDEKPKSTRNLQRVRNVRTNPRVTLLVDRYCEDWSRLAWVQARGRARVLEPRESNDERSDAPRHDAAVSALESKYGQYAAHDLSERRIIAIRIDRTVSWGALEADGSCGENRERRP